MLQNKIKYLFGVFFLLVILIFISPYRAILPGYHAFYKTPKKYQILLKLIENQRIIANNAPLVQKQKLFINSLTNQIFPFWYGTIWSFYGHTKIPGDGTIACGYFVTTTLQNAGIKLNSVKLAQCASEEMIKTIVQKKYIYYFNSLPITEFIAKITQKGAGLYLIGLDNHTGFIQVDEQNNVNFIHASGRFPFCVINENAAKSTTLKKSVYKVVGKMSEDEILLNNWTKNKSQIID